MDNLNTEVLDNLNVGQLYDWNIGIFQVIHIIILLLH